MIFNDTIAVLAVLFSRTSNAGFVGMTTTTERSTNEYRQQRLSQTQR